MEKENGRFDFMEDRLHSGSFRQKSKVPRPRFPQRSDYVEYSSYDHRSSSDHRSLKNNANPTRESLPQQGMSSSSPHLQDGIDEHQEWQKLLGERVCISGVKQGILRYYGRTNFAQGYWCGVELDEPVGKNNGTVNGVVYFICKPNHGIFAPVNKVSKLNDLNGGDWRTDLKTRHQDLPQSTQSWDYNVRLMEGMLERKLMKNSNSDPNFTRPTVRSSLPHSSQSFPYDKRSFTEQRERGSLSFKEVITLENCDMATSKRVRSQSGNAVNVTKNPPSSCMLGKYGYGTRNQYFSSNVIHLTDSNNQDITRDVFMPSKPGSDVPKRSYAKGSSQNGSLASAMEECEYFLRTPTNSGEASPLSSDPKRFNEMSFFDYKMPDELLNAFQSRDFPDPEDERDNDDQMSVDFDESLGILTPSQMKDFTLFPDLTTSCSDIRAIDFPSSESFDDINDLPEDEQVHDVSVHFLPESSSKSRSLEVTKQSSAVSYSKKEKISAETKTETVVSRTDKFLYSISQKDFQDFNMDPRFSSKPDISCESRCIVSQDFGHAIKINNLSSVNVLDSDKSVCAQKEIPDKFSLEMNSFTKASNEDSVLNTTRDLGPHISSFCQYTTLSSSEHAKENVNISDSHNLMDSSKIKIMALRNFVDEDMGRKSYDTDSSRDSLLQADAENNTTLKEKLTVSWEDCVSHANDCMFTPVERPESVYTVASSDTGFQEDGEMEGEVGMTTSIDSTEGNKRFSTTSRDSCIVTEEVDGYKIAESNSTSGYSTGLSDSCCNDRPDDDISGKPLTDEEIQDSVGLCDSEDALSFQDNSSISKEGDNMNAEVSEVTTETVTALCHDSTSEALCETMVEDATLTEIHDLLLSPEENQNVTIAEDKENKTEVNQPCQNISETNITKMKEKSNCNASTTSSAKSTPEKKVNVNNRARIDTQRNQRSVVLVNKAVKSPRLQDEEPDRKKQLVKSPKKNVMSKIKAMIEATSCKTMNKKPDESIQKRVVSAPKRSRWEAVTSKIAASLAEEKTKSKVKREIKSRVDTNLALARQQIATCRSPKLDSRGDGSLSPISVSSRRPLSERNSAPSSVKDGKGHAVRDTKHGPKSPRPGKPCITSRSTSPVAASESSTTSVSVTSHNSRSKIAHWKGSSSTVASSAPPPSAALKRQTINPPTTKPPLQTARTTPARMVTKKTTVAAPPRISLTVPNGSRVRSLSPSAASSKTNRTTVHARITKEQSNARGAHHSTKPMRPPMWLSKAELTQEIQRLGNLCEARTKELNRLKMETRHVTIGFEAFAALFKYMVDDLNALSVPKLSQDLEKTLKQLELTKQDLAYYEKEVEELKAHHCQELNDLSNKLFEVYHSEVAELIAKHQEEMKHLKSDHQKQIENLSEAVNVTAEETKLQHEKLVASLENELITQREELQLFQEREIKDLEEKHAQGTKILQEHIEQLEKKCAELRQHSMSMEDAMRKDTDSKLQWVTSRKVDLEKEVESLKAVLEMKNKELHSIRVQNLEMEKQLEELPFAREKIKMLQARAEDLEALMVEKTKLERKLTTENQEMRDSFEKEAKVNRRLSMENEELQWRLRQAEHSIISGSFLEVAESPEESENAATSPSKSPAPQILSRSVFFTFMDKDDSSPHSPRSQYKKITPGFSANYKTSPGKATKSPPIPSPRKTKSHSEPPQPVGFSNTPRKVSKQPTNKNKGTQKRQRSGSDCGRPSTDNNDINFLSVTESMTSSVSSESSVFEHKERLLEEHKDQILASLEILREQRSSESATDDTIATSTMEKKWCSDDSQIICEPSNFEHEDMSRSAEFADPKTYYHMTFPVLKETGIVDCDTEDSGKVSSSGNSPLKEATPNTMHSMAKSNQIDKPDEKICITQSSKIISISSHEICTSSPVKNSNVETKTNVKPTHSEEGVHKTGNNDFSDSQDRWRTI